MTTTLPHTGATSAIEAVTLEVPDPAAAQAFYAEAFGLGDRLKVRTGDAETSGFRGYTLSLVVSQPGNVDALINAALSAGATTLKDPKKSFWGYGGGIQAPDGAIWKVATSTKKDKEPITREVDELVLLLGVNDVKASKAFYVDQGLTVGKSFGSKYVELKTPGANVKLALYGRRALAKDAGVAPEGSGAHRIVINANPNANPFTDPDGFTWEPSR